MDAHYYLGKLYLGGIATDKEGTIVDCKDLTKAESHFLKVMEIDKSHSRAHYNLAKIKSETNKTKEAETLLKKAISLDQEYSKAHFLIAHVFEGTKRKSLAEKHFVLSIKFFRENAIAHYRLGVMKYQDSEFDKSLSHLKKSAEINPQHAESNFFIAMILRLSLIHI